MLTSRNDVLRKKHEDMETAYEIWESLQAMFGQQSDQCCHEATRSYMNAKIKKGVSVRERVLNMINLMHKAVIHGATLMSVLNLVLSLSLSHLLSRNSLPTML